MCTNHLNRIPESFKTVILLFLVLFEHDFFEIHEISVAKETGTNMYDIFRVIIACFRSPEVSSDR